MARDFRRYACRACGVIYDEALGDPDSGLAAGTRFEDIPDDWRCPVCGVGKGDFDLVAAAIAAPRAPHPVAPRGRGLVVVGAGTAGWAFVKALRLRDTTVPVTLVTACDGDAYHKPLLSVSFAKGRSAGDLVERRGVELARELGVRLVPRAIALRIDRARRRLVTTRGTFAYRDLVLAFGSRPRPPALEGDARDQLITVNDLAGYARLRAAARTGGRVALLGAGLVGTELAANLAEAGVRVLLSDPAPRPLAGQVAAAASEALAARLAALGIDLRCGARALRLDRAESGFVLAFDDGRREAVDAVVACAGLGVDDRLAGRAGLAGGSGIAAEAATMRTGDAHVFAIGECADLEGKRFGYVEPILAQARACAAAVCGDLAPFVPRAPLVSLKMPRFPMAWGRSLHAGAALEWKATGDACHEAQAEGRLAAYVLTGPLAGRASEWHGRLA